jgi:uncharacterized membrane protein YhhN
MAPSPRAVALLKTLLSVGFVATGAFRAQAGDPYSGWMVAGLVLSAVGDAFLLSEGRCAFLGGLTAFLLAHLAYAAAFAPASAPSPWGLVLVAAATGAVLLWLWPRLGRMRVPVVVYACAIGGMLWLAWGTGRDGIRAGAVLFWLSDLLVAKRRFGPASRLDRPVGWTLYFAGQYLLALSIGG